MIKSFGKINGITLISLVITIIVLLILAGVSIGLLTGDNGILNQASNAKTQAEIAEEIEIINLAIVRAESRDKYGELKLNYLTEELSEYNVELFENIDSIIVKFVDKNRYYEIYENGDIKLIEASGEKNLTIQYVDSEGKVLAEEEHTIFNNQYSINPPEIEGYECAVEKIEGEISESTTITQLYYMIFEDDTTLVFTGLNSSGTATTTESEIVSYMIGDGTTTTGNALKEKTIQGIVKIPDTYNGKTVTQIGQNAFAVQKNIKKAMIGDNIKTILSTAFDRCQGLVEIKLGKSTSSVGGHAFRNCNNLKIVTIESEISGLTFNCFIGCTNFTEIKVNDSNTTYKAEDNILYSTDGKTIYLVPTGRSGELLIPEGVETIYNYAASYNSKLQKVVISDMVETIQTQAFVSCTGLQEISFGKNISNIGGHAFKSCNSLKTVTIESESSSLIFNCFMGCSSFTEIKVNDGNATYKVEDNILYSKDGKILYLIPTGRSGEIQIPEGVETICNNASSYNTKLQKVVMSDTVETIQTNAFLSCSALEEVIIGKNVSSIISPVFKTCNNLKTITIDSATIAELLTTQISAGYLINVAETIYIKEDITTIGTYIISNYTIEATDKTGYIKYVKN